jgi:hypothetical protein
MNFRFRLDWTDSGLLYSSSILALFLGVIAFVLVALADIATGGSILFVRVFGRLLCGGDIIVDATLLIYTVWMNNQGNFYGAEYEYEVYRHPDGRRRTPRKYTVRIQNSD